MAQLIKRARREDAVADAVVVEDEEVIRKEEDKDKRIGWPVSMLLTRTERFRQMNGPKLCKPDKPRLFMRCVTVLRTGAAAAADVADPVAGMAAAGDAEAEVEAKTTTTETSRAWTRRPITTITTVRSSKGTKAEEARMAPVTGAANTKTSNKAHVDY